MNLLAALQYLVSIGQVDADRQVQEIHGLPYAGKAPMVVMPPSVPTLRLSTLDGLVDYVKSELEVGGDFRGVDEADERERVFVHVESPVSVAVVSRLTAPPMRHVYARAIPRGLSKFHFSTWLDPESFIIDVQTSFVPGANVNALLDLASNVVAEKIHTSTDDGVSQVATVRKGARAERKTIENPISLAPYRTFAEVPQPESQFIVRIRIDEQRGPLLSLYESQSGRWDLAAIENIVGYLNDALDGACGVVS